MRQLMGLTRSQDEGHRPSEAVGDHAGLGPRARERPSASRWSRSSLRPALVQNYCLGLGQRHGGAYRAIPSFSG